MVGTIEEYIDGMKKPPPLQRLTSIERTIIGQAVRITIPVHKLRSHQVRAVCEAIRGMANAWEFAAQRSELTEMQRMFDVRMAAEHFKRKVSDLTAEVTASEKESYDK